MSRSVRRLKHAVRTDLKVSTISTSLNMSQHSATTSKKPWACSFECPIPRCNQSSGLVAKSHFSSKGMDSSVKLLRHMGHLPWAKRAKIWNNRSRWIDELMNQCLDCISAKVQYWLAHQKIAVRPPALHLCLVHCVTVKLVPRWFKRAARV